jgi:hypothetical protein
VAPATQHVAKFFWMGGGASMFLQWGPEELDSALHCFLTLAGGFFFYKKKNLKKL